jgi:hypothetical protein
MGIVPTRQRLLRCVLFSHEVNYMEKSVNA